MKSSMKIETLVIVIAVIVALAVSVKAQDPATLAHDKAVLALATGNSQDAANYAATALALRQYDRETQVRDLQQGIAIVLPAAMKAFLASVPPATSEAQTVLMERLPRLADQAAQALAGAGSFTTLGKGIAEAVDTSSAASLRDEASRKEKAAQEAKAGKKAGSQK